MAWVKKSTMIPPELALYFRASIDKCRFLPNCSDAFALAANRAQTFEFDKSSAPAGNGPATPGTGADNTIIGAAMSGKMEAVHRLDRLFLCDNPD